ncbi:phosphoenolpyruvate--protein phosphotransferase [Saliphagus sp. GCM10025334]
MPEDHHRRTIDGTGAAPLVGVGTAVWARSGSFADLEEPPEPATVEPAVERGRFDDARARAREELERERERTAERIGEAEAAIFDAHRQFLDDPQITDAVADAIADRLPAEHAVRRAFEGPIGQFQETDVAVAERADDLRDVRDRLLRILTDDDRVDLGALPNGAVVLARRLTPTDAARLDPDRVAGFATVEGGRTAHAAIFARSIGIPAVVDAGEELRSIEAGATVLVDGDAGSVFVDPTTEQRARAEVGGNVEIRSAPVSTANGKSIAVDANVCTLSDLEAAVHRGADGIGLFRTEFLFLDRPTPPNEDEQVETYAEVLDAFPEGRVVVRTLDAGGDKPISSPDRPGAEHSFLGERGIRRSLGPDADRFETQLRALLRAEAVGEGSLSVLFPMVSTVGELEAAIAAVESAAGALAEEGVDYAMPELGAMIETPSAALLAEAFADHVDFLSIGTNDLTQYVMAAARGNDRVAHLHDPCEPAVLRIVERAVRAGHSGGARIGMCGEMAADPELTELLIGLGLDELSVTPHSIPEVKASVTGVDTDEARSFVERALEATTKPTVRDYVADR